MIRPAKLADAIADYIEKMILEGVLRPGEKLAAERELAEKLDVSRPSLREALDKLQVKGLLETSKAGTVVVAIPFASVATASRAVCRQAARHRRLF